MSTPLSWPQVLAWRLQRSLLEPVGELGVAETVERVCGVQAQVPSSADLAVRVRRRRSGTGDVQAALADGETIRTWAMRGTIHLLEPRQGAAFLALIADARPWARPSWQRAFGMSPQGIDVLREVVATALEGRALTREELISAVSARPGLEEVGERLRSGWGTLLKTVAWQGELCHGPNRGTRVTFMRPTDASPAWTGLPDLESAARTAVTAYLGTYGPATPERFGRWLAGGFFGTRKLRDWFASLGEAVAPVEVDGEAMWALSRDVPDLAAAQPGAGLHLVPGFDQWVLGPGTDDGHVVPSHRRGLVSRQAGWISPVVLVGGVVSGTWQVDGDVVAVAWFSEAGRVPEAALEAAVGRLGGIVGRALRVTVTDVPG